MSTPYRIVRHVRRDCQQIVEGLKSSRRQNRLPVMATHRQRMAAVDASLDEAGRLVALARQKHNVHRLASCVPEFEMALATLDDAASKLVGIRRRVSRLRRMVLRLQAQLTAAGKPDRQLLRALAKLVHDANAIHGMMG